MGITVSSLLEKSPLASCSAITWPHVAGALDIHSSMLDLVEEAHSCSVSPVLKALPANVLHHGTDASRCAGSIIIAHISGGSELDLL